MAVTTTNLGVITAYGDAVAAGYTGTKAEWQALMASYATVAEEANDAKDDAVAAKNTAVSKATEATTAATTATTKASEASASAQSIAESAAQIQENTDDIDQLKNTLSNISEKSDNLFQFLNTTKIVNSVSITTDSDNNVTFSGTASSNGGRLTAFTDDFVLKAGTYTIGQIVTDQASESALTRCAVSLQKRVSGTNVIATVASPNVPVTFTLDADTTCYVGFNLTNAFVYNNVKMAVMLNAGSTLKEYESPQYVSAIDREYRSTEDAEIVPYTRSDFIYGRISASGEYQLDVKWWR